MDTIDFFTTYCYMVSSTYIPHIIILLTFIYISAHILQHRVLHILCGSSVINKVIIKTLLSQLFSY